MFHAAPVRVQLCCEPSLRCNYTRRRGSLEEELHALDVFLKFETISKAVGNASVEGGGEGLRFFAFFFCLQKLCNMGRGEESR